MIKKIINYFRKLYYRRLFRRLVFAYLKHESTSVNAAQYADDTLCIITGRYYEDFMD